MDPWIVGSLDRWIVVESEMGNVCGSVCERVRRSI